MAIVINGFAEFLPYVFMLAVVGIIWDACLSAFRGWF
jgi:hypothetical protein